MEMLIVVAIIGILVAIAVPVFSATLGKTRQTACLADMRNVKMALSLKKMTDGELTDQMVEDTLTNEMGKKAEREENGDGVRWKGLCPEDGIYSIDYESLVITCTVHGKTGLDNLTQSHANVISFVDRAFRNDLGGTKGNIFADYFAKSNTLNSTGGNYGNEVKADLAKTFGLASDSFDFRLYYDKRGNAKSCKIYLFDKLDEGMINSAAVSYKGYEVEMSVSDNTFTVGNIINEVQGTVDVVEDKVDGKTIPVIDAASIKWK